MGDLSLTKRLNAADAQRLGVGSDSAHESAKHTAGAKLNKTGYAIGNH